MKILVTMKRVPDPTQKAKVKDGHIDLTGASYIPNTFDEYALETALRLVENGESNTRQAGGEIVLVSLGPDDAGKEIRNGLAMGADRAIHVVDDGRRDRRARRREGAAGRDRGGEAGRRRDGQAGGRRRLEPGRPDARRQAELAAGDVRGVGRARGRRQGGGWSAARSTAASSTRSVTLPAVITVDLRIIAPHAIKNGVTPATFAYAGEGARLPSLKGIMAAKKKPLESKKLADYGAEPKPLIKELTVTLPPGRAAGQIVADIPTLVKKLADEAKAL